MRTPSSGVLRGAAAVITIVPFAGSALGQCPPSFAPATFQSMGGQPYTLVIADFNGDGWRDLATANFSGGDVAVRLQNAHAPGTYAAATSIPLGLNPRGMVTADFNGDGRADLAAAYNGGGAANTRMAVMLGTGNGTFAPPVLYPIPSQPFEVRTADVNNDGRVDLLNICGCGSISILRGNADGTFAAATSHAPGTNGTGLAVGDFNADGLSDLFVPSYYDLGTRVALAVSAAPSYAPPVAVSHAGLFGPWGSAAADLNSDGVLDVVTTFRITNKVAVMLGNGAGGFTLGSSQFTWQWPQDVALGDVSGDGHLDAVVANWGQAGVSIHLGDGAGNLGPGTLVAVTAQPNSVVLADMNNDGKLDIVTADQQQGVATILLNQTATLGFAQHPFAQRVCPGGGGVAVFNAAASTNLPGGITVRRWQALLGGVWTNLVNGELAGVGTVSGATTAQLTITNVQGSAGDLVATLRCTVTASCGTASSQAATLNIIDPCGPADLGAQGGVFSSCGDGVLDNNDFVVFIDLFFQGDSRADLGQVGGVAGADGLFDNNDFVVYIDLFFTGCQE